MMNIPINALLASSTQDLSIEHLTKVVRVLWHEVERLEHFVSVGHHEVVVRTGGASIVLKSDGSITIKGNNVTVEGASKVIVKAAGDLVLKGAKIVEN